MRENQLKKRPKTRRDPDTGRARQPNAGQGAGELKLRVDLEITKMDEGNIVEKAEPNDFFQ